MNLEISEDMEVIVDGRQMGFAADVIINHLEAVPDAKKPSESLSHRVARGLANKAVSIKADCEEKIAAAEKRAEEAIASAERRAAAAERRAQQAEAEAERFRPARKDEIERAAQAKANEIKRQRAIDKRADELAG